MSAKRIKLKKKKQDRTQVVGRWFEIEVVDGVTRRRVITCPAPNPAQLRLRGLPRYDRSHPAARLHFLHFVRSLTTLPA